MPSPFPGMNPWFEQEGLWLDFHTKFLTAINERLVGQVRPKYIVLLEQKIYVHEVSGPRLVGRADVSLHRTETGNGGGSTAVLEAPAEILLTTQDVERVPYLEVRDRFSRELVTVLEMLSPTNKRGDDRRQYLAKRSEVLDSAANLVEIDLLRGGRPMPDANRPDCTYSVVVSRPEDRPRCGFWPIGLKERLPEIPVPLRRDDGEARIDLQEVLNHVYDVFGYEDFVYSGTPDPALSPEDARWSREVLGSRPNLTLE
jgi:Protein of unknown function (DUF4058)